MPAPAIKYAIYPGTITLDGGGEATFTAEELAVLYSVDDESYLEVADAAEEAALKADAKTFFQYIHLKPRPDGMYYDIKDGEHTQDDSLLGKDFDGSKKWVQETKRPYNDLK